MKKGWLLFCFLACLGLCSCSTLPQVLRLQVVGAGDSDTDQAIKLQVKSAVVSAFSPQWAQAENAREAYALAQEQTESIRLVTEKVLDDLSCDYGAKVETGVFLFPEKSYDGQAYPAGPYRAVRITLGEGEGANWWCMLYPPLCLADDQGPYYYSWILEKFGLDASWKGASLWQQ